MGNYVTVDELIEFLGLDVSLTGQAAESYFTRLDFLIKAKEEYVEMRTHRAWREKRVTEDHSMPVMRAWGRGLVVFTEYRPIKAWNESLGDKVEIIYGNMTQSISVSQLRFNESEGIIYINASLGAVGDARLDRIRITYRYGEEFEGEVKNTVKLLVMKLVQIELLKSQLFFELVPIARSDMNIERMIEALEKDVEELFFRLAEVRVVS